MLDSLTYAGDLANIDGVLENLDFVKGDIRDKDIAEELRRKHGVILKLAAGAHNDRSLKFQELFVDVKVIGVLNLIQAWLKYGKRFHQVSTDEVYEHLPIESKDNANSP